MRLALSLRATLVPLACSALAACSSLDDPARDHGAPGSLRAAVFDHYDELAKAKALPRANGAGRADFSETVGAFVRPGMRFDEVAALLKQNGFEVGALPPREATGMPWQDERRHELLAGLQVASWVLVGRADVACELAPSASEGDGEKTVGAVHCWLYVGML